MATQRHNVKQARGSGQVRRRATLPEYLEHAEVDALIRAAPTPPAALLFLTQWRAGLRVSEALALEVADYTLGEDRPTVRVRGGKGGRDRLVPLHAELGGAIRSVTSFSGRNGRLVDVSRVTAHRWLKLALAKSQNLGAIPAGRKVATHTLRHSAARHWLASGIPINVVSRWLGHASLQTTLIYLQILPDPLGDMDRVP